MTSLRHAAVKGTFWSAVSTVFNRGLRFVITIFLARLLLPSDFGLVAMGLMVMDIAGLMSDLGLGAALIQRKQLDPQHLTTCFWANQMIGVGLWGMTVGASPWVAAFYRNADVRPILSMMALNFLIAPLGSIPWVLLNRELKFKELMITQTMATAVRAATSLALAWRGAGVWSLVWGPLAGTITGSIVNWWYCRWRPSIGWSWTHFRELFRFGKNVFGEKFLGFFSANSDNLITGRFLGATTLGFYNFAYQIPHLAETHLAPIVTRVLFPVLSKVQDDRERLRRGYLQSLRWIMVAAAPFAIGLFVAAPEFVPVVYGAQWQPVVFPLQILCLAGLIHALTTGVWTVQQSIGRPDIGFWWNLWTLPLIIGTLIASARWGIIGVATAMLTVSLAQSLVIQHITNRLISLSWRRFLGAIRAPVIAAACMGVVAAACRLFLLSQSWSAWAVLGTTAVAGGLSYALFFRWLAGDVWVEGKALIAQVLKPAQPAMSSLPYEVSL